MDRPGHCFSLLRAVQAGARRAGRGGGRRKPTRRPKRRCTAGQKIQSSDRPPPPKKAQDEDRVDHHCPPGDSIGSTLGRRVRWKRGSQYQGSTGQIFHHRRCRRRRRSVGFFNHQCCRHPPFSGGVCAGTAGLHGQGPRGQGSGGQGDRGEEPGQDRGTSLKMSIFCDGSPPTKVGIYVTRDDESLPLISLCFDRQRNAGTRGRGGDSEGQGGITNSRRSAE
jgi:hypothetical protein